MDQETAKYYDANAAAVAWRYEQVEMHGLHQLLLAHIAPGCRVLEIGCGSGREAAFLLANSASPVPRVTGSPRTLASRASQTALLPPPPMTAISCTWPAARRLNSISRRSAKEMPSRTA